MGHRAIVTAVVSLSSLGMAQGTEPTLGDITQTSRVRSTAPFGAPLLQTEAGTGGGWSDVLVTDPGQNTVFWLQGCDLSVLKTFRGTSGIGFGSSFAVGDLDCDGLLDLVVGSRGQSRDGGIHRFRISTSTQIGFIPAPTNGRGQFASNLLIADLDCDGKPEIITTDSGHDGVAGVNSGWVAVYDGATLALKDEMFGIAAFGELGKSLAVAAWPGRSKPVLLVGEPGHDSFDGRVCVLDSSLNLIDEISWTVPLGTSNIGSGPIGQAADGKIVICSPSASIAAPGNFEGNVSVYDPATDTVTYSLDGSNTREFMGSSFAFATNGTLLVISRTSQFVSSLLDVDPSAGTVKVLAPDLNGTARIFQEASAAVFSDGTARSLLEQPASSPLVSMIYGEVPDMISDRTIAFRGQTIKYTVDLGPDAAGGTFFPFASRTGDGPVTVLPGLTLALTIDALTLRGPDLFDTSPVLDADGRGCFNLPIPAGTATGDSLKVFVSGVLVNNGQLAEGTCTSTYVIVNL